MLFVLIETEVHLQTDVMITALHENGPEEPVTRSNSSPEQRFSSREKGEQPDPSAREVEQLDRA